jgi:hypothetical protein
VEVRNQLGQQKKREVRPNLLSASLYPKNKDSLPENPEALEASLEEVEEGLDAVIQFEEELQSEQEALQSEADSINNDLMAMLSTNSERFVIRFIQTVGE